MLNFSNLIAFRVNGVSDKNNLDHIFYPIENTNIRIAEEELGFSLPQELAVFFEKVGYGFFWQQNKDSFDRLLSPQQIAQINLKKDFYESDPDLEVYDDIYNEDKLLFFEVNEGLYLAIDKNSTNGKNAIYYFEKKIFDSFDDFIEALLVDQDLISNLED